MDEVVFSLVSRAFEVSEDTGDKALTVAITVSPRHPTTRSTFHPIMPIPPLEETVAWMRCRQEFESAFSTKGSWAVTISDVLGCWFRLQIACKVRIPTERRASGTGICKDCATKELWGQHEPLSERLESYTGLLTRGVQAPASE